MIYRFVQFLQFKPVASRNADDLRQELPPWQDVRVLVDHLNAVLEGPLVLHVLVVVEDGGDGDGALGCNSIDIYRRP